MRSLLIASLALGSATAVHAECKGQLAMRPNKQGVVRQVCLDGKYTTCISDSRKGGWTQAEAKRFCDGRRAAGAIK